MAVGVVTGERAELQHVLAPEGCDSRSLVMPSSGAAVDGAVNDTLVKARLAACPAQRAAGGGRDLGAIRSDLDGISSREGAPEEAAAARVMREQDSPGDHCTSGA